MDTTETVTVTLYRDEWYAWFVRDGKPRFQSDEVVAVPMATLRRWQRAHKAFNEAQNEMRATADAQRKADGEEKVPAPCAYCGGPLVGGGVLVPGERDGVIGYSNVHGRCAIAIMEKAARDENSPSGQ